MRAGPEDGILTQGMAEYDRCKGTAELGGEWQPLACETAALVEDLS